MKLIIVGLMRSGTSTAAKACIDLGVGMGEVMMMPQKGLEPEYEDFNLVRFLGPAVAQKQKKIELKFFEEYAQYRAMHTEHWGFKSPFLLPYLGTAMRAWGDCTLVLIDRKPEDAELALRAMVQRTGHFFKEAARFQKFIAAHIPKARERASFIVPFEELIVDPKAAVKPAVDKLGGV